MKATIFSSSTLVILFSSLLFLAGCAGLSGVSSSAPPTPAAPPTSGSSAHGTFIYVRTDNSVNSGAGISGFRMNPDGTLTTLQDSPFSILGNLAVSGNFLLVANQSANSVTSYRIDPSSGSLTPAQTVVVPGTTNIGADSKTVYVGGHLAPDFNVIYAFSIDANGSFAAISGSPFTFSEAPLSGPVNITVQNSMFFASDFVFHGDEGGLSFYYIQNGALVNLHSLMTGFVWSLAAHPSGRFVYGVNDIEIEGFTFGSDGVLSRSVVVPSANLGGFATAAAIDPTGKFLAALGNTFPGNSQIALFFIDQVTGSLTELGAPVSTGEPGGNTITFDPSGRFVLTSHAGAIGPNDVMVFSFDPASGSVTKIQSTPTAGAPGGFVIATF